MDIANIFNQIKSEHQEYDVLCKICLSGDRKLTPLGDLSLIFQKFLMVYKFDDTFSGLSVCWECNAILRKFVLFQNKVTSAFSTLMRIHNKETISPASLSTLNTKIISEDQYKTLAFSEKPSAVISQIKLETSDCCNNEYNVEEYDAIEDDTISLRHHPEDDELKNDGWDVKDEGEDDKSNTKTERPDKHAPMKKKAKYKLVSAIIHGVKPRSSFMKVPIGDAELMLWLGKERTSKVFVERPYKCKKCIVVFNNEATLVKHTKSCHRKVIGEFMCDICRRRFPSKSQLATHCRNHYFKYKCSVCDYECYKRYNQYYHMRCHHVKMFQCMTCSANFRCRKDFNIHYKESHENYVCDYCGVRFKMRHCLEKHIRKKHCPLKCKDCGKEFPIYSSLWLHRKLKHPVGKLERAYCVECNKHFDNVYSYKWHLNNSVRHRPKKKVSIQCPGCDKVFTKNIYMKDHYDLVHLKKFKYRCEQCDKNFVRNADLVKHTRRVHEGIQTPKNKICYVCGRGFSSNKILTNHIRTHTGERPYHCGYCSAKFVQKVAMIGHVRNVHFKEAHKQSI